GKGSPIFLMRKESRKAANAKKKLPEGSFLNQFLLSKIRLRGGPQIGLDALVAFGKFSGNIFIFNGSRNDHVFTVLPVGRSRHAVVCRQLKAVDHTQDLVEVPARRIGIG